MNITTVLLILIPIVTAIISSYLTYYLTVKSKKDEAMLRFKEEKYSNLVVLLQGFVGRTASADTKKKFFEEQHRSWLYCSDEVVRTINDMVKLVINSRGNAPEPETGRKAIGSIVLEMRKDLLGRTELTPEDFTYVDVIQ